MKRIVPCLLSLSMVCLLAAGCSTEEGPGVAPLPPGEKAPEPATGKGVSGQLQQTVTPRKVGH